jgi:hypothetical protein
MRSGFIAPCLPTKAKNPPSGDAWLHEIKHDGFRVIARKDGDGALCRGFLVSMSNRVMPERRALRSRDPTAWHRIRTGELPVAGVPVNGASGIKTWRRTSAS